MKLGQLSFNAYSLQNLMNVFEMYVLLMSDLKAFETNYPI
jgi:hypothetical protein